MKSVLVLAMVVLALPACGGGGRQRPSDGRLRIAAAFHPLAEIAARVGGDRVVVDDLTPSGAEPHDVEVTSDDLDRMLDADLVILLGHGFQPALEDAAGERKGPTVSVLDDLDLPERNDPHVWLDPTIAIAIARRVADALHALDPTGDARDNEARFEAQLVSLDHDITVGLRRCERHTIVTAHEAFGWFARRYGLVQEPIAGVSPDQEPDPDRLGGLIDHVEREGVTTVFTEERVSPKVAESLARAAHVRTAVLDPLEVDTGRDYATAMRANLVALRRALSCA
jgi:zinc transport system substrate-binding protein